MPEKIKATKARSHFNEMINRVRYGKERLIITLHNQEAAILISPEDYALLQRLEQSQHTSYDFSDVAGKLTWQGNALNVQNTLRDEW